MLRDITIGQYYPAKSILHKLDPRAKVMITLAYLISLFLFKSFLGYAVVTLFLFGMIRISRIPFRFIVKGLRTVVILLVFTAVFNILWTPGIPVFEWRFIRISEQGIRTGIFMSMRLIYLILGSSLLTLTTTPNQLTDAFESLMSPLKVFKVPVHDFAMMMSLALRFIPILIEEANRIISAQSARGADFEEGNLFKRMRAMISILVPLLVSVAKRSDDLAMAMEARCYRGGDTRTKMKPLNYQRADTLAFGVCGVYLAVLIVFNRFVW